MLRSTLHALTDPPTTTARRVPLVTRNQCSDGPSRACRMMRVAETNPRHWQASCQCHPHHHEFVEVLFQAPALVAFNVDELLDHRTRSIVDLADPLPIEEVYLGGVVNARLGHDVHAPALVAFTDPPAQGGSV